MRKSVGTRLDNISRYATVGKEAIKKVTDRDYAQSPRAVQNVVDQCTMMIQMMERECGTRD